ncbi:MAG: cell division protein FtsQ/DivIB [Armatimonadota bacterium]
MATLIALAAFPQSALFAVEHIEVAGATILAPGTVSAIAGLRHGDRLFAIDAGGAVRRLQSDPRIKSADVRVRPPRTVEVLITERRPVVALVVGDQFALLGDDLIVVALISIPAGLPEVVDRLGGRPWARAGSPVASEAARLAIAALPAIPPVLGSDLRRIVVAAGGDLTLVLRSGLVVRAGGSSGLVERLAQVPQVLEILRGRGVEVSAIDLRYAGSIAVTQSPGGEGRPGVE